MGFRSHVELCKVTDMLGINVFICLLHEWYICLVAISPFVDAAFNLSIAVRLVHK